MNLIGPTLLFLAVLALGLGARAGAATAADTFYVDGGSRGGGCSDERPATEAAWPQTPWCSLDRALEEAPSGSTIAVREGRYPELEAGPDRERHSIVTFMPRRDERVEIDGLELSGANHLRFTGFVLTGEVDIDGGATKVQLVGNDLQGQHIWLSDTTNVLLEDNHIHDILNEGDGDTIAVRLIGDRRAILRGNRIERVVEDPIQVSGVQDVLIDGNELLDAHPDDGQHTDAIHVLGADGLTIRGNYIRDVEHGLQFTDKKPVNVTIENNVIAEVTSGYGMKAEGAYGMPGLRVVNNTWADTSYGVTLKRRHPGAVVRNNIFDRVDGLSVQPSAENNLVAEPQDGVEYGPGAVLAAPQYVNGPEGNFELAAGSPGIDAGIGAGAPRLDRLGRPRSDDEEVRNTGLGAPSYVDVGAHERVSGSGGPVFENFLAELQHVIDVLALDEFET
jgi:hypothetical protein